MKKLHIFLLPAALAAVFIIQQQSYAQEVISNSLISSGASTSSNSSYTFTGTVGQPAIGEASNASYTLISNVEEEEGYKLPTDYKLFQNYPNPFNPETTIKFKIPKTSFVTIKIYNVIGELIRTLVNTQKQPGIYSVKWDSMNNSGNIVSSGVYVYHMQAGSFSTVKKMIFIK